MFLKNTRNNSMDDGKIKGITIELMEHKMDLRSYLFVNNIKHKEFAKKIEITESQIYKLIHKICSASILTAAKIQHASGGEVLIKEMLSEKDKLTFENYLAS